MRLANDLLAKSKQTSEAAKFKAASTGRPAGCVDELGNPESSNSIGKRYGCSYGKILWLFKKYADYQDVYRALGYDYQN